MHTSRAIVSLLLSSALSLPLVALSGGVAHAETVAVDPGAKVSAGKPITGTGENLPSLNVTATWNIGSFPAPQVQAYYDSGEALRDQTAVARAARTWAKGWARKVCGSSSPAKVRACKAAAVFDIDDTLLSSYPTLSTNSPAFTFSSQAFDAAADQCTSPAIEPVAQLYRDLQRMGFTMMIITGRSETLRDASAACLEQNGVTGWKEFILKPAGSTTTAAVYKAQARRSLVKEGWRIGPSVGDQVSDMSYGSMVHGFLVPNPMYFIP